jgi:hypothetical protein
MTLGSIGSACLPGVFSVRVLGGVAPITFSVTGPDGNTIATSPPATDGSVTTVTFPVNKQGTHTVTATDANGCRVTCSGGPGLSITVRPLSSLCISSAVFKTTVRNGTAPYTFTVADPDGMAVNTSSPVTDESGTFVTFPATKAGRYRVLVSDAGGCLMESSAEAKLCCSLTQSKWSKKKPKFNDEKRTKTLKKLFTKVLGIGTSSALVLGVKGERSFAFNHDSSSCIMERLPASGPPAPLPDGLGNAILNRGTCQTSVPLPLSGGKFQNELLGQTIALILNAGDLEDFGSLTPDDPGTPTLWHFILCNTMVTQGVLSGSDVIDPGTDGILGTQDDPKTTVSIPISVINAIASGSTLEQLGKFTIGSESSAEIIPAGTVGRLIMLANFALAGETNLGGVSLADINTALSAVNSAFDSCRVVVSCDNPTVANL